MDASQPAPDPSLATLVDAWDPVLPVDRATLPPPAWATDPRFAALDRDAVLRRRWHCVGPLAALRAPGAYLTGSVFDLPWAVVRGEDGVLRGFVNLCRHQSTLLLEGSGTLPGAPTSSGVQATSGQRSPGARCLLRCPYHGWAWRTDGAFDHAPHVSGTRAFERPPLLGLPVLEWGALAFVWLGDTPPAPPPDPALLARLDATGWRALHPVASEVFEVAANWKVYVDNYLDGGYHIPVAHPGLDAELDPAAYTLHEGPDWSIQASRGRADDSRTAGEARYAWLHPTLCINRYGDWLDLNLIEPLAHDRTRVVFHWLHADPGLPAPARDAALAASRQVQDEDAWLCARVHRGKASPWAGRGRYVARMEPLEHHFHRLLHADYRAWLGGGEAQSTA